MTRSRAGARSPVAAPEREYSPASEPLFVIVTEPVASAPIAMLAAEKTAPEPERSISSVPAAKALLEIVTGVAVKLAYVPPAAAMETALTAAAVSAIFLEVWSLILRKSVSFSFRGSGCLHTHHRRPTDGEGQRFV